MVRLAAVSIMVMLGFRGFEGWEGLQAVLGPLAGYSPPVVFGMVGLALAAASGAMRALDRGARISIPVHVPLMLGLLAVYVFAWLLDVAVARESPRGHVVILELLVAVLFTNMVYLSFRTEADLLLLQRAVVFAALGVGGYLLYRATFLPEPAVRLGTFSRANYADLSYLLAAALWMGPVSRFVLPGSWKVWRSSLQVVVLLGAGLVTGTRAGIWTVLAFVPLLLAVLRRAGTRGAEHWFWFIPASFALGWSLVELLSTRAVVGRGLELFSFNRGEIWAQSFSESTDSLRALFLGAGTGAYSVAGNITYPHNFLLEVQYNGGLVATALASALVGVSVLRVWRYLQRSDDPTMQRIAVPAIGLGVVAIIGALITYEVPSNLLLWIFVAMSARMHALSPAPSAARSRVSAPRPRRRRPHPAPRPASASATARGQSGRARP